jgi:hypothetical protein
MFVFVVRPCTLAAAATFTGELAAMYAGDGIGTTIVLLSA